MNINLSILVLNRSLKIKATKIKRLYNNYPNVSLRIIEYTRNDIVVA